MRALDERELVRDPAPKLSRQIDDAEVRHILRVEMQLDSVSRRC